MNIEINFDLKEANLLLEDIILLSLLDGKKFNELYFIHKFTDTNVIDKIYDLEQKGWVKILNDFIDTEEGTFYLEAVSLREKAEELLASADKVNMAEFIAEYRSHFPSTLRSEPKICATRMRKFMKDYPKYSPELIILATKEYNLKMNATGNMFRRRADYFINKAGISDLAGYCELLKEGGSSETVFNSDSTIRL